MGGDNLRRALLKLFSKRELAATQLLDLASAAYLDGWGHDHRLARKLVAAGRSGRRRNEINEDVIRAAESEGLTSSRSRPYMFPIATGGEVLMFLPHEWYPSLVEANPSQWCLAPDVIQGGRQGMAKLLQNWAKHEDVQFDGDLSTVGMFGFHADGVQYTSSIRAGGGRSILVGSINVISAATRELKHMRQPLFVLRKTRLCQCGCQGYDTLQEILEVLSWSLGCLAKGLSPSARHDGSAWTEQDLQDRCQSGIAIPRAALLQVRGDWEWLEQCFRFRSVSSEAFCWMCNAVQRVPGPLNFHDFSREAAHRHTLITHEAYMEACMREGSPPATLFQSPGFRIEHVTVDAMHSADLGTFADAIGSLFWLEITHKPWHRNK